MGEVNPYLTPGTVWIQAINRPKLRQDGSIPQNVNDIQLGLDYWYEFRIYKVVKATPDVVLFYSKKFKHYAQYPMSTLISAVQSRRMYPGVLYASL